MSGRGSGKGNKKSSGQGGRSKDRPQPARQTPIRRDAAVPIQTTASKASVNTDKAGNKSVNETPKK